MWGFAEAAARRLAAADTRSDALLLDVGLDEAHIRFDLFERQRGEGWAARGASSLTRDAN